MATSHTTQKKCNCCFFHLCSRPSCNCHCLFKNQDNDKLSNRALEILLYWASRYSESDNKPWLFLPERSHNDLFGPYIASHGNIKGMVSHFGSVYEISGVANKSFTVRGPVMHYNTEGEKTERLDITIDHPTYITTLNTLIVYCHLTEMTSYCAKAEYWKKKLKSWDETSFLRFITEEQDFWTCICCGKEHDTRNEYWINDHCQCRPQAYHLIVVLSRIGKFLYDEETYDGTYVVINYWKKKVKRAYSELEVDGCEFMTSFRCLDLHWEDVFESLKSKKEQETPKPNKEHVDDVKQFIAEYMTNLKNIK